MASTRFIGVRIAPELESAARSADPALAALDRSTLIRVGLAVLAGHPMPEAVTAVRARRSPKSRTGDAA